MRHKEQTEFFFVITLRKIIQF